MRHIIALSLLGLTACGSGGPGTQSAQTSSPATGSHYLMITDSPMAALPAEIEARGISITYKHADGYSTATTVDGTVLDGANSHIADWLAERQYDGIILVMGGQETLHDPGQFVSYAESRFQGFMNQLNFSGRVIVVATPNSHSSSYAINNENTLGITVIEAGFGMASSDLSDAYTPNASGLAKIADELVTNL